MGNRVSIVRHIFLLLSCSWNSESPKVPTLPWDLPPAGSFLVCSFHIHKWMFRNWELNRATSDCSPGASQQAILKNTKMSQEHVGQLDFEYSLIFFHIRLWFSYSFILLQEISWFSWSFTPQLQEAFWATSEIAGQRSETSSSTRWRAISGMGTVGMPSSPIPSWFHHGSSFPNFLDL